MDANDKYKPIYRNRYNKEEFLFPISGSNVSYPLLIFTLLSSTFLILVTGVLMRVSESEELVLKINKNIAKLHMQSYQNVSLTIRFVILARLFLQWDCGVVFNPLDNCLE